MHKRELAIFVCGVVVGVLTMVTFNSTSDGMGFIARGQGFIYRARVLQTAQVNDQRPGQHPGPHPGPQSHEEIDSLPALNATQTLDDHHDHVG